MIPHGTTQKKCASPEPLGLQSSFGFGDRLGVGTPGHLTALQQAGGAVRGIFAQQSMREMTRTQRSPDEVMRAAVTALDAADYQEPWGADADHLKTPADIQRTMAAGFTLITLDPSDEVDQLADRYTPSQLEEKFAHARQHAPWVDSYLGRTARLPSHEIAFDRETLVRAAVKYGPAIEKAIELGHAAAAFARERGADFELELSVDETAEPTTPAEHYIFADQLRAADVNLVSVAPRFVGEFEKGVDYKGDLSLLEASFRIHAEIAQELGPYKLSLHSGSDKISIYSLLARTTAGRFHVKTAGTSYLEALRVAAQLDPALFREIVAFSRSRYEQDKATYLVSARLEDVPAPADESDPATLERLYLQRWSETPAAQGFTAPGRQILHCTFGSVATHERLGPQLASLLREHAPAYCEILREHFVRHLTPLVTG